MNRCCSTLLLACAALLSACASTPDKVDQVDDAYAPGIFLDPGNRDVLPPGVTLRAISANGLVVTKVGEGWRSRLYEDVARYCTIGYGHLIRRAPCNGTESPAFLRGLTEPEGESLLVTDMAGAQRTVMNALTVDLTDDQYAALCDFVFNVGPTLFKTSTLLRVVNARQFDQVPVQLRRWIMAGGKEIPGLRNRREAEIKLFFGRAPVPRGVPEAGEDVSPLDIRTGK